MSGCRVLEVMLTRDGGDHPCGCAYEEPLHC